MSQNISNASLPVFPPFPIYPMPWSVGMTILALLGIFGNINIIIATFRGKNMKNKCNYLIAINAAVDCYAGIGGLQMSAYVYFNELTMANDVCMKRIGHAIFAMIISLFLFWSIGLDRLFAIKFPASYSTWDAKGYLCLMLLPAIGYAAISTTFGFLSSSPDELVLLCMPPTAFRGIALNLWMMGGAVINILVVATYGWVYVLLRKQARSVDNGRQARDSGFDPIRRLTESLLLIMIVYIMSWLLTVIVMIIVSCRYTYYRGTGEIWPKRSDTSRDFGVGVSNVSMSASIAFHISLYVGWNATISIGCNYYVYFSRSSDYAQMFKEQLCCWQKKAVRRQPLMSIKASKSDITVRRSNRAF